MSISLRSLGFCDEPSIEELLSDPIAKIVMRYDGIDEAVVLNVVDEARRRMSVQDQAA